MIDKTWLNDYIEQMESEAQEDEKDSIYGKGHYKVSQMIV